MLESSRAFNRTIYHLHQELEFTLPFEETFEKCRRFVELYERMYPSGLPYTLFEVRFTPEGHDLTLIGAGRDRRSTWIDLVCNDSCGFERLLRGRRNADQRDRGSSAPREVLRELRQGGHGEPPPRSPTTRGDSL